MCHATARLYRRGKTYYVDYTTLDGHRVRQSLRTSDRALAKQYVAQEIPKLEASPAAGWGRDCAPARLISEYIAVSEREHAPQTFNRYSRVLEGHFARFLGAHDVGRLGELHPRHVERYKTVRLNKGAAPRTVNLELKIIRTFLNWVVKMGDLEDHPFRRLTFLRDDRKTYRYLEDWEAAALIEATEGEVCEFVLLALYAGLRRGEIWALDPKRDFDLEREGIIVRTTKSKEPRVVPMHQELVPVCRHLAQRSPLWSFSNPTAVWKVVKSAMKRCGINATLHDLRHTFCRNLARSGASERYIMEIAGHQDIKTTQIYTRDALSPEHLKLAISRMPRIGGRPAPCGGKDLL